MLEEQLRVPAVTDARNEDISDAHSNEVVLREDGGQRRLKPPYHLLFGKHRFPDFGLFLLHARTIRGRLGERHERNRRGNIDGRRVTNGAPSASGAGRRKAPLSSFFIMVSSPSKPLHPSALRAADLLQRHARSPSAPCASLRSPPNYSPVCQTDGKLLADRSVLRLLRSAWPRTLEELEDRKSGAS